MTDDYLSRSAELDLEREWRWYHRRSPLHATRLIHKVSEAIDRIVAFPDSFPVYDGRHRFVKIDKYPLLMVYRVRGRHPLIIAIGQTKRSKAYWKRRLQ